MDVRKAEHNLGYYMKGVILLDLFLGEQSPSEVFLCSWNVTVCNIKLALLLE